ncbi:hypothetical protein HMPREF1008_00912 [Olsenella sp. oral taxon 809 str. F0356]|nr:hypothetical protein HMPREF1008_00912 [Olsenella sp. oral taxon 809 str. F0356]
MPSTRGSHGMARLLFAEQFIDDAEAIYTPRLASRLERILRMVESFPLSGSSDLPDSIRRVHGDGTRKCSLPPFDLIYEYDEKDDAVTLMGIIPQRRMW